MTYIVKTRGAPRPVRKDFRCRRHGVFTAFAGIDDDRAPCPRMEHDEDNGLSERCGIASPWSPSVIPVRMRRVEATRGQNDAPEHANWDFQRNLEEGQDPDDYQADRDAKAERDREQFVVDSVRSDR